MLVLGQLVYYLPTCQNSVVMGLMEMEIPILISDLTRIPRKKRNSLPRSTILRDFQNQEYRFTIPKYWARPVEKQQQQQQQ